MRQMRTGYHNGRQRNFYALEPRGLALNLLLAVHVKRHNARPAHPNLPTL